MVEANHRGKVKNKEVYLHVVGLGLGLWKFCSIQESLFLQAFHQSIFSLSIEYISDIDFSWFNTDNMEGISDKTIVPGTNIKVHFSKRNPADKLAGDDEDKLLVFCYAWDGNAFPGNEFWSGNLSGSGDSAAAACSQIAELHNPLINRNVTGSNMRIVTKSHGLCTIKEYLTHI